jgi:diguanylate cyclase (GGDEF)-like protein/PAS domain S-box-containing protein
MPTDPLPLLPSTQRLADRSPRPWHVLAVLLVLLLVGLLVGLASWRKSEHRRSQAQASAQNLARQLEAPVADALVQADVLLRTAAVLWRETGGGAASLAVASALRALAAALPESSSLRIADADGHGQWGPVKASGGAASSSPPSSSTSPSATAAAAMTQREEFQRARADADAGLIITSPVQRRAEDPAVLVLSRALHGADGRFAGLVSVDLPTQRLASLLSGTDLGERSVASLRTASLTQVVQSPAPDEVSSIPDSAIASAALREAVAIDPLAGMVEAADGAPRIQAYRRVQGYPLYLLVDLPGDGPAQGGNLANALIAALALAALGAATRAEQLQRRRSQRQRDAALQPWTGFVAAAHDAVISETLGGQLTGWNPAACQLFGYSAQQMLGQSLQRLVPAAQRGQAASWVAQVQGGQALSGLKTEWLHRDGQPVPILLMVLPTRDAAGHVDRLSYIVRDLSAARDMAEALRQQAFHDPLTGLPNRRLLHDRLGRAQQNSRRMGSLSAVLALGLDLFAPLQRRLGPAASEQWLLTAARRLVGAVRETDTVARLDGAAFVVVCENLGADPTLASLRAAALEAKISSALSQPALLGGETRRGQVSIGHRLFSGSAEDIDRLIADAELAMIGHRAQQAPRPVDPDDDGDVDDDPEPAEPGLNPKGSSRLPGSGWGQS